MHTSTHRGQITPFLSQRVTLNFTSSLQNKSVVTSEYHRVPTHKRRIQSRVHGSEFWFFEFVARKRWKGPLYRIKTMCMDRRLDLHTFTEKSITNVSNITGTLIGSDCVGAYCVMRTWIRHFQAFVDVYEEQSITLKKYMTQLKQLQLKTLKKLIKEISKLNFLLIYKLRLF